MGNRKARLILGQFELVRSATLAYHYIDNTNLARYCSNSVEVRKHTSLNCGTHNTSTSHNPYPLVVPLLDTGPEAVLLALVSPQLLKLGGVLLDISLLLARLVLLVTAEVAENDVVADRTEDDEGVKHAGTVEEYGEGQVAEGVAEIATFCQPSSSLQV